MRMKAWPALWAVVLLCTGGPAWSAVDVDPMCGPKSLLVICEKLGVRADLKELADLSSRNGEGTTLLGLYRAAKDKGLKAAGMKIGLDELIRLKVPAIAHLWGNHFVVVERGPQGLEIRDPSARTAESCKECQAVSFEQFTARYSGFALLVGRDDKLFPQVQSTGSDIRFDEYKCDLGFLNFGDQIKRTMAFRNAGNLSLGIRKVHSSSPALSTRIAENIIPPGGRGEIEIAFDAGRAQGIQGGWVFVHSNDQISPLVLLTVSARVKPDRVAVSRRSVTFGTLRFHEGAKREIVVNDPGDKSLVLSKVVSSSPFLIADVAQRKDGHPGYLVTLELKPEVPIGEFEANVTLHTNHPKEPQVEIPVTAIVKGNVEASPGMFFFGYIKKGQVARTTVVLRNASESPLAIERIESPLDFLVVDITEKQAGREYLVTATLTDPAPLGSVKGDVVVHTNDPHQPQIRVPVYGIVEGS